MYTPIQVVRVRDVIVNGGDGGEKCDRTQNVSNPSCIGNPSSPSPSWLFTRRTFSTPRGSIPTPSNYFYKSLRLWCRSPLPLNSATPKALTFTAQQHHGRLAFLRRSSPPSPFGSHFARTRRARFKGSSLQPRSTRQIWRFCPKRRDPVCGQIRQCPALETIDGRINLAGCKPAPEGSYVLFLPR